MRRIERALPIRSSFSGMAIGMSMTAVAVECDENSAGDKEIKRGLGAISPAAQKRGRTMSAVTRPLLEKRTDRTWNSPFRPSLAILPSPDGFRSPRN